MNGYTSDYISAVLWCLACALVVFLSGLIWFGLWFMY